MSQELIEKLRTTASKGVSVWGDLQMEAAKEIEDLESDLDTAMQHNAALLEEQAALKDQEPAGRVLQSATNYDGSWSAIVAIPHYMPTGVQLYLAPGAQHGCKFPMCHSEEYQQALAKECEQELYGAQPRELMTFLRSSKELTGKTRRLQAGYKDNVSHGAVRFWQQQGAPNDLS